MKALIHETFGDPAAVLKTADLPTPEPAPGQVRLRMLMSPIHNHDLWTIAGSYGVRPALPATAGSEAVGIVEALGAAVPEELLGHRVVCAGAPGTWAESFLAPASSLIPVPDGLEDSAAAQLIAMPFSALALLDGLAVEEGDWVVQTAANGAVGKIFAKLAASRGVRVLNLVRRPEAVADLEALDMGPVLSTSDADWQAQARTLIGEAGARAAVDSVGGATGAALLELLGQKGELVVFGTATGEPLPIPTGAVIFKDLTIKGFWGKVVIEQMDPDARAGLIGELLILAAQGGLPLDVDRIVPLTEVGEAMTAARTPGRRGKVMLHA